MVPPLAHLVVGDFAIVNPESATVFQASPGLLVSVQAAPTLAQGMGDVSI